MKQVKRRYCICCGEQRDEHGITTHDFECMWYGSYDVEYIDEDGEVKIFLPYKPKELINK